jgi:hypothetical protein
MDKLKAIFSDWKGWASVFAILLLIATALSARLRKIITKVLVEYLAANWRRFYYWITNKTFWVSGGIHFTFPENITTDQKLIDEFGDSLRTKGSVQFEGSLSNGDGSITLRLTEFRDVDLLLSTQSGQALANLYQGANGYVDDGAAPRAETSMSVTWGDIAIRYREFRGTLGYLRQTIDEIRNGFAKLVNNSLNEKQNVHLEVFSNRNREVDGSVKQTVPVPGGTVSIERLKGETKFGAVSLDAIIAYLPHYLVRETISDLMKKHNLVM